MTMASSTTKPVAMVSAISDRLLRLKPAYHISAKAEASDKGSVTPGDEGRARRAQKQQHDEDDEADADQQRELHLVHRGADRARAVGDDLGLDASRQ